METYSSINAYGYHSPYQYDPHSLQWCFHCPSTTKWVSTIPLPPHPFQQSFYSTPPPLPNPTFASLAQIEMISNSISTIQDILTKMKERNSRMDSSFSQIQSLLHELQLESMALEDAKIVEATVEDATDNICIDESALDLIDANTRPMDISELETECVEDYSRNHACNVFAEISTRNIAMEFEDSKKGYSVEIETQVFDEMFQPFYAVKCGLELMEPKASDYAHHKVLLGSPNRLFTITCHVLDFPFDPGSTRLTFFVDIGTLVPYDILHEVIVVLQHTPFKYRPKKFGLCSAEGTLLTLATKVVKIFRNIPPANQMLAESPQQKEVTTLFLSDFRVQRVDSMNSSFLHKVVYVAKLMQTINATKHGKVVVVGRDYCARELIVIFGLIALENGTVKCSIHADTRVLDNCLQWSSVLGCGHKAARSLIGDPNFSWTVIFKESLLKELDDAKGKSAHQLPPQTTRLVQNENDIEIVQTTSNVQLASFFRRETLFQEICSFDNFGPGSFPPNLPPDIRKMAIDTIGKMSPEEMQNMFEMASLFKEKSLSSSKITLQDEMQRQRKYPAMRQTCSSLIQNTTPVMMDDIRAGFHYVYSVCSTILVDYFSRVVLEVLQRAAQNRKLFSVLCNERKPDMTGFRQSYELTILDVHVRFLIDFVVASGIDAVDIIFVRADDMVYNRGIIFNMMSICQIVLIAKSILLLVYVAADSYMFAPLNPIDHTNTVSVSCPVDFGTPTVSHLFIALSYTHGNVGTCHSSTNFFCFPARRIGQVMPRPLAIAEPDLKFFSVGSLSTCDHYGRMILVMNKIFSSASTGNKCKRTDNLSLFIHFGGRILSIDIRTHIPKRLLWIDSEPRIEQATTEDMHNKGAGSLCALLLALEIFTGGCFEVYRVALTLIGLAFQKQVGYDLQPLEYCLFMLILDLIETLVYSDWKCISCLRTYKRSGVAVLREHLAQFSELIIYSAHLNDRLDSKQCIQYELLRSATRYVGVKHYSIVEVLLESIKLVPNVVEKVCRAIHSLFSRLGAECSLPISTRFKMRNYTSFEWIIAMAISLILDKLIGVSYTLINVKLLPKSRQLALHFVIQRTPIMMGGSVIAYTLLDMDYSAASGYCSLLLLHPYYTSIKKDFFWGFFWMVQFKFPILNLEDKVLIEGGSIVVNITKMEGPFGKIANYIWHPGEMPIYRGGN